ncbi:MAG: 4-hydroxy-tetrahydrodipicolinate reductase [Bdellovibrionales bacterium]
MITTIAVAGITGRMGKSIADIIKSHPQTCLAGGLTRAHIMSQERMKDDDSFLTHDPEKLFAQCDVIIDFTHANATADIIKAAIEAGKPLLCGTTGLSDEVKAMMKEAAKSIPFLYASNTSLSLAVTKKLVALAARLLKDQDYDVSILDRHHRWKKDAPSGTALSLGEAVIEGNGGSCEPTYAAIRSGAIIGEHEILFGGHGEYITVRHQVTDRRVFAQGAVDGALWLAQQPVGFYTMDDVLGA